MIKTQKKIQNDLLVTGNGNGDFYIPLGSWYFDLFIYIFWMSKYNKMIYCLPV